MALQIIPQQQPVGLALLGNQLQAGAADYAARRDQERRRAEMLTDEARRLNERRQDVDVARSVENTRFDRLRQLQMSDEQRRRGEGLDDAAKKAALDARFAALQTAASRGLFDIQQIGNIAAEDAALSQLQGQVAKDVEFSRGQPANAQARLQELTLAEQAVTGKMAEVERRLSAQPTIDQSEVMRTAVQMATQANGGKTPGRDKIQEALPDAMAKAQNDAQVRWWQDKQDAQVQYQLLNSQLNTIRQQQSNLTSTFHVAPSAAALSPGAAVAPSAAPVTPTPGGRPLQSFIDELNKMLPPPPAENPQSQAIQDTTRALSTAPASAAPLLRQGRTQLLSGEYEKLDAPVMATEAKLADVQNKLQALQTGVNPFQSVAPSPMDFNPAATSEFMTNLLIQEQALQRQLEQDRAKRSGAKTGLLSGIPAVNTQSNYMPVTPPSAGALLSPR